MRQSSAAEDLQILAIDCWGELHEATKVARVQARQLLASCETAEREADLIMTRIMNVVDALVLAELELAEG
jgi:hypothetical protein